MILSFTCKWTIVKANKEKQRRWREKNSTSWIFLTKTFGWCGTLEHPPMWEVSYQKGKEKEAEEEEEILTDKEEEEE